MYLFYWLWKTVTGCGTTCQGSSEEPDKPCREVGALMNDIEIIAVYVETGRFRGCDWLIKELKLQPGLTSF